MKTPRTPSANQNRNPVKAQPNDGGNALYYMVGYQLLQRPSLHVRSTRILGLCLMRVLLGDVPTGALLLLNIVLICECLLLLFQVLYLWHVTRVHLRCALLHRRTGLLLGWKVLRGRFFGRLDGVGVVDAILAITRRFGGIQAGLVLVSR